MNVRDGFNQKVIITIISQRFDDKEFHFVAETSEKKKKNVQIFLLPFVVHCNKWFSILRFDIDDENKDEDRVRAYWLQIACQPPIKTINLAIIFNQRA